MRSTILGVSALSLLLLIGCSPQGTSKNVSNSTLQSSSNTASQMFHHETNSSNQSQQSVQDNKIDSSKPKIPQQLVKSSSVVSPVKSKPNLKEIYGVNLDEIKPTTKEQAMELAERTILASLQAEQSKDISMYMNTLDVSNMNLAKTTAQNLFKNFDLQYSVVGQMQVNAMSKDFSELNITYVQQTVTTKPNSKFKNNQVSVVDVLQYMNNMYRITEYYVNKSSIKYLP